MRYPTRKLVLVAALGALCAHAAAAGPAATPPLAAHERDRAAILAMAGTYRVSFDFVESVPLKPGYKLATPQHSVGTELVLVLEDSARVVELQHLLLVGQGQRVVKHWRQRWEYEPEALLEFRGERTFARRRVTPEEARGAWSQSVFEVDDAPRYQALGRWSHDGAASSWESQATWRPLPRREYTKRSDYQVLGCRNRHTLVPTGWVHEQDNVKLRLLGPGTEALAREVGLNRYERAVDVDANAALAYWRATEDYWRDVRATWSRVLSPTAVVIDDATTDGQPRYAPLLALADTLAGGTPGDRATTRREVERLLARHVRPLHHDTRVRPQPELAGASTSHAARAALP